ncbi:type II toxin-antitoxin system VapC family toxin [uncultured Arthrobacter sp.]|uniref:type II toxin-antitoxin system VapC family toxin n=1 Tax=uncultured Arthrobacter sp. TaxID=114050 RepID=UPI002609D51D|nr:type II toxin-antitoxin system VapC family toxin [uncultured Arthrobacter sp.]
MIYVDTSALAKIIVPERESEQLRRFFGTTENDRLATSHLTVVELHRTALRHPQVALTQTIASVLSHLNTTAMTQEIVNRAAALKPAALRALDAIHVATALEIRADLLVTYDRRMVEACQANNLEVVSPGAS